MTPTRVTDPSRFQARMHRQWFRPHRWIRNRLLRIPYRQATFASRGFSIGKQSVADHLERIGYAFLERMSRN